ncbi:MAG: phenylacetic acid degradation bifunctional protein PaaZ [Rhizobiaceae bacterium]|nr:phenylacetic acid degradation bifunctional protein PaaZ [Rhizobiaceae bacterium]
MTARLVSSYCEGEWVAPGAAGSEIFSPLDGALIGSCGDGDINFEEIAHFARTHGGNALRAMTFHQRAHRLKALATYLNERREQLYELSFLTGATWRDAMIDIDGGISTLFVYSSKGRREMPDSKIYRDGGIEQLSQSGNFLGQHICTPRLGVGVHINAFNFPAWGMLEKMAPTLLAGVPAIVKPATQTSFLTQACFAMMIESKIFPPGSIQLIAGGIGDLFDHLGAQDIVSFTGSAQTAGKLKGHEAFTVEGARFMAEQDSLNATVLGTDCTVESEEFTMAVREVVREMTTKAGQKCTAIRRIIVPSNLTKEFSKAVTGELTSISVGDPRNKETRMGALVSHRQKTDVLAKAQMLAEEAELVFGDREQFSSHEGAYMSPLLFHCSDPDSATNIHSVEAFGPVATIMPYRDTAHAIELVNRGGGSLVASIFTNDNKLAREFVEGAAAWHGRLYFANRHTGKEGTGHGSPLPHMVHGGPGRAGGGEELGGIRGVMHYMQRTAIQGNPDLLGAITDSWVRGSQEIHQGPHPFRMHFGELEIGKTFRSKSRQITLEDIEHFAEFTGDNFYAHMDEEAASANPFFPGRVAHGYLLLSFAAGLFVDPDPGPVLANYGLDNLRFLKPVSPGDSIYVRLSAKEKTNRNEEYGEVLWDVELFNQDDEPVASYNLLTMNAH